MMFRMWQVLWWTGAQGHTSISPDAGGLAYMFYCVVQMRMLALRFGKAVAAWFSREWATIRSQGPETEMDP